MAIAHGRRVVQAGEPLEKAKAAMILIHGRGATAEDIMTLAPHVQVPGWAYLAPQSAGAAWYPNSYKAPIESNEPYLTSALEMLSALVQRVEEHVPVDHQVLFGFSQGACLILEFAARNASRYGGLVGLSGGLIGPEGTPRNYPGSFDGTPAFLGCSDVDSYIRKEDVLQAGQVLERMGAKVDVQLYPGMDHVVSEQELAEVRSLVSAI